MVREYQPSCVMRWQTQFSSRSRADLSASLSATSSPVIAALCITTANFSATTTATQEQTRTVSILRHASGYVVLRFFASVLDLAVVAVFRCVVRPDGLGFQPSDFGPQLSACDSASDVSCCRR